MQTIPTTPGLSSYVQRTVLDGREYHLTFAWNMRQEAWFLSIADQSEVPIVSGLRLVADFPITRRITDARWQGGQIFALDSLGEGKDPGYEDLGARTKLLYFSAAELA